MLFFFFTSAKFFDTYVQLTIKTILLGPARQHDDKGNSALSP